MTDFSQMPINEVANYNTAEALDYFWGHKDFTEYFTPLRMKHYHAVAKYIISSDIKLTSDYGCAYLVDFGCGCGQMINLINSFVTTVSVGVDYAFSAIKYAKQLNPLDIFMCGDITVPIFPPESYDLALCIEVLEHITDYRKALTEIMRTLHVGGSLVLTVPNALLDLGAPYHVNFWTRENIVDLLAEYGEIVYHEMIMDNVSTLVHVRKVAK